MIAKCSRAPFSRSSDSRPAYSIIQLIKIESYELFQFPNCSRVVVNRASPMYIFARFTCKLSRQTNWNKCTENVTMYQETMFRS